MTTFSVVGGGEREGVGDEGGLKSLLSVTYRRGEGCVAEIQTTSY